MGAPLSLDVLDVLFLHAVIPCAIMQEITHLGEAARNLGHEDIAEIDGRDRSRDDGWELGLVPVVDEPVKLLVRPRGHHGLLLAPSPDVINDEERCFRVEGEAFFHLLVIVEPALELREVVRKDEERPRDAEHPLHLDERGNREMRLAGAELPEDVKTFAGRLERVRPLEREVVDVLRDVRYCEVLECPRLEALGNRHAVQRLVVCHLLFQSRGIRAKGRGEMEFPCSFVISVTKLVAGKDFLWVIMRAGGAFAFLRLDEHEVLVMLDGFIHRDVEPALFENPRELLLLPVVDFFQDGIFIAMEFRHRFSDKFPCTVRNRVHGRQRLGERLPRKDIFSECLFLHRGSSFQGCGREWMRKARRMVTVAGWHS